MPSRRSVLGSGASFGAAVLAGCAGLLGGSRDRPTSTGSPSTTATTTGSAPSSPPSRATTSPSADGPDPLRVATSWDLERPLMRAASFWNGNPASSDEYDRSIADGLDSGVLGFAGHFGRRHGFDPSGERHRPPFRVAVGNTDAEDALDALVEGTADLAELGTGRAERDQVIAEQVAEHHLFRAGSVLAASRDVSARGVESLAREELVGIYDGRVTNWAALGGPDREIRLVERVERTFLEGAGGGIDELYGRPERLRGAVRERDDVLTRVFPRDVGEFREGGGSEYRILELERDGQRRGPGDRGYPSTVPLPLFTRGDPDGRERAFLDALSTDPVHPWILDHEDAPLRIFPAADPPDY